MKQSVAELVDYRVRDRLRQNEPMKKKHPLKRSLRHFSDYERSGVCFRVSQVTSTPEKQRGKHPYSPNKRRQTTSRIQTPVAEVTSITQRQTCVVGGLGMFVPMRSSLVGIHASNGGVERYCRTLHGQIRALRSSYERLRFVVMIWFRGVDRLRLRKKVLNVPIWSVLSVNKQGLATKNNILNS